MKTDLRITYQIAGLEHTMRQVIESRLVPRDIGLTGWAVLNQIAKEPGLSVSEISRLTFITQQAVSKITARLERMGLVVRDSRTDNRRIQNILATDEGRLRSDECEAIIVKLEEQLRSELGDALSTALYRGVTQAERHFFRMLQSAESVPDQPQDDDA